MKKSTSEKKVRFQKYRTLEDNNNENQSEESDTEQGSQRETRSSATKKAEFPYRKVPQMVPVVEVPPIPAQYMRQIPSKALVYRYKAPVEDRIDPNSITERILESEVKLSSQELMAVSPKVRVATKNSIVAKRTEVEDEEQSDKEAFAKTPSREVTAAIIETNQSEAPTIVAGQVLDEDGCSVDAWTIFDPITQYLAMLTPEQRMHQVFSIEAPVVMKEAAQDMTSLQVIPTLINGVREEESILDSGSQIVFMPRKVATTCKLTWDPNLCINM
ncbi:hypothetical protein NP233_g11049 [Leucocoprinus birnbaumii]|uniref:Uncharacterized protein n=1 Tax=Leucocoprinus birnbaumii TaxID=56174 RepID=A0AAD5VHK9_9AGAR|nr:hypothetical protein NP233_g11049 [Leucocoprinus birnbaumii]